MPDATSFFRLSRRTDLAGQRYDECHLTFRIPIHLKTKHGTILIACNSILEREKVTDYSVVIARSVDGDKTFEKRQICTEVNLSLIYD